MNEKKKSVCVKDTLEYMRQEKGTFPVRVYQALESGPLAYRTFGGQERKAELNDETMERVFGGDYLLTILTGAAASRLVHAKGSVHTFYTDAAIYRFFDRHGLLECGLWDEVDHITLDRELDEKKFNYEWAYSACKPYATLEEIKKSSGKMPLLFHDADLILRRSCDHILHLKKPDDIVMGVGHIEETGTDFYPDFHKLKLPECFELKENQLVDHNRELSYRTDLPAANSCLMYFSDMDAAEEWAHLFEDFMKNNHAPVSTWLEGEQLLLTSDQRPALMVAARRNLKEWKDIGYFLPLTWTGKDFQPLEGVTASVKTNTKKEWHYYRPEYFPPEKYPHTENWNQTIQHTWIQKRDIETHIAFGNYVGCFHLELLQALCQKLGLDWERLENSLRTFSSLERYFTFFDSEKNIEEWLLEEKKKPVQARKMDDVLIKGLEETMFPEE